MHPVLFEFPFFQFPLRSFGVLVAVGFLLGIWVWGRLLRSHGEDPEQDPERASQVAVWVLIGVIGGARLMYVGVEAVKYLGTDVTPAMEQYLSAKDRKGASRNLRVEHSEEIDRAVQVEVGHDFVNDPITIAAVWKGGLVMYGGVFGAILVGTWAARKRKLNPLNALDTGLVAGFVGQTVGRWGCLLVGDDHGSVVPEAYRDLPFPLTITVPPLEWLRANPESLFDHELAGQVLWATQPWMSINALIVALVGYLMLKRRRWYGQVAAVVMIHYSITRFLIEMFRGDGIRGKWFGDLISTSQLVAIPVALFGLWLLIRNRGRNDLPAQTPTAG